MENNQMTDTKQDKKEEQGPMFLPSTILDQLYNRVCRKMDYLRNINSSSIWNEPIGYCQQIEKDLGSVDSIVLKCIETKNKYFSHSSSPMQYSVTLTLVYILLYFRHHDDDFYKTDIFQYLKGYMGIFGSSKYEDLEKSIIGVIEFNNRLNKKKQEYKRSVEPQNTKLNITGYMEPSQWLSEEGRRMMANPFSIAGQPIPVTEMSYYQYYKDRCNSLEDSCQEKDKENLKLREENINLRKQILEMQPEDASKRIVIAKGRQNDFVRVIKAMHMDNYFEHADHSEVDATEIGNRFLKTFNVTSTWKSALQSAFSVQNLSKTFDDLMNKANEYLIGIGKKNNQV